MPINESNSTDSLDQTIVVINDTANNGPVDVIEDAGGIKRLSVSGLDIDWEHNKIHLGHAFTYREDLTLQNLISRKIAITTPNNTNYPHFTFDISVTQATEVYLYENPTTLVKGSAITPFNRNRNSATTSGTTLNEVTSVGENGTEIYMKTIPKEQHTIATSAEFKEFILKGNEEYIFEIKSLNNGNEINFVLDWYDCCPS